MLFDCFSCVKWDNVYSVYFAVMSGVRERSVLAPFLSAVDLYKLGNICSLEIVVDQLKGSVKVPNMFHNYETEKITRKASDAAENLQSSCSVLSPEIFMHDAFNVINVKKLSLKHSVRAIRS